MISSIITPGRIGNFGKCPSNIGLVSGNVHETRMVPAAKSISSTRSRSSKYSRRMGGNPPSGRPGSGGLGGDQLVDPRAQILQDEIFLNRCLALIDFLRPRLQRNLD